MMTEIALAVVGVLALAGAGWCWWFENGGKDDTESSEKAAESSQK